jgi:hypothetical protein
VITVRSSDDQGSIIIAMIVTVVGIALSAMLVPILLGQISTTNGQVRRIHELDAAQAGIDVAIGHIRAANDGSGNGLLPSLPCGPFTGSVGVGGTERYQVTIAYYSQDPSGRSASDLAANQIKCISGGGTGRTPAYALLISKGTDSASGDWTTVTARVLQGTYTFQTTNQNIPGGLIHVYKTATSTDMCMDAGSGSPTSGTPVLMRPCSSGSTQQKFAYNTNLTIALLSSKTATLPLGMCLDAGKPEVAGAVVAFLPCGTTTLPQQQWSINDSANFEGTNDGVNLNGLCLNVQSPNTANSPVILGSASAGTCRQGYDNKETFSPEASVGAGAAGASTGQLVNFYEFGRCVDVTEQNVNYGYLIAWPCKQAPNPANVTWNQKYSLPAIVTGSSSATGAITTKPSTLYCLRSPGSTATGQYVKTVSCTSGSYTADEMWTVYGDTGSYATAYRIMDSYGYCLAATDPTVTNPDFYPHGSQISKIVVAACSASTLQKWNAPANVALASPLKDLGES